MNKKQELLKLIHDKNDCHIGSCLSCFEIIQSIYKVLKPNDKFILSKSHASKVVDVLGHVPQYDERLHVYGGSLGNGIGIGVGMALADPSSTVYVLVGDGEMNEGSCWEAINFIQDTNITNIKIIIDYNGHQGYGYKSRSLFKLIESAEMAFGNEVKDITNTGILVWHTIKGNGIKDIEDKLESHYVRMNDETYEKWSAELA